jgi:ABC-type multidrug transport system fused ATPase/permease subunit
MENGNIRKLDTYHNLVNSDPEFKLFVRGGEDSATADSTTNVNSSKSVSPLAAIPGEILSTDDSAQNEGRTVQSVSWSVYGALISPKASAILFAGCIPFLIVGNGSTIISQLWLSWWSSDRYDLPRNTYIAIYVSLAIAQLLFLFLFGFMLHLACANSTGIMFNRAVRHLLNAPVSFFDHTPLGRHMNRLTSDVDKMDIALPETLRNFAISLTALIPIFTIQIIYYKWVRAKLIAERLRADFKMLS